MKFIPGRLDGVWLIEMDPKADERGSFVRTYCEQAFGAQGLNVQWPQANLTRTVQRGTIRGLHWQAESASEIKLVRCAAGAIWDVVVDIRKESATYGSWEAYELTSGSRLQLYVPAGFAHGFQSLSENAEVSYMMGAVYVPALSCGIRWDDPQLAIKWPLDIVQLSARDRSLPLLSESK